MTHSLAVTLLTSGCAAVIGADFGDYSLDSRRDGGTHGGGTHGGGGTASGGDATSSGGKTGAGGQESTGGKTNTGGVTGDGGATNTGGVTGAGGATSTGGTIGDAGATNAGGPGASCEGLAATCGASSTEDCCTSSVVTGGTFYRSYDGVTTGYTSQAYPATVSDFRLDKYEVTVGRFRKFVGAYAQGMTPPGAGKNPNNASDSGWNVSWTASLPATAAALISAVKCDPTHQTWTDAVGTNENRPISCVNWYEAFAFCVWDGGRLPTEAELNYAGAGGSEQRVYPWGVTAIDCAHANFGGASYPSTACVLPGTGSTNDVGSESPTGDGKWGQADLAGNMWEWAVDWYATYTTPCQDCAALTLPFLSSSLRVLHGGSFTDSELEPHAARRGRIAPATHGNNNGIRCARSAP